MPLTRQATGRSGVECMEAPARTTLSRTERPCRASMQLIEDTTQRTRGASQMTRTLRVRLVVRRSSGPVWVQSTIEAVYTQQLYFYCVQWTSCIEVVVDRISEGWVLCVLKQTPVRHATCQIYTPGDIYHQVKVRMLPMFGKYSIILVHDFTTIVRPVSILVTKDGMKKSAHTASRQLRSYAPFPLSKIRWYATALISTNFYF